MVAGGGDPEDDEGDVIGGPINFDCSISIVAYKGIGGMLKLHIDRCF